MKVLPEMAVCSTEAWLTASPAKKNAIAVDLRVTRQSESLTPEAAARMISRCLVQQHFFARSRWRRGRTGRTRARPPTRNSTRVDNEGDLDKKQEIEIFNGRILLGNHTVNVQLA